MLCALIMAGGKGERFWPLSTNDMPKQFLNLLGDKSMLQMTVDRIKKLIPIERIFVVTCKKYEDLVKEQINDLPDRNIIIEPVGRNTAPCIGLSAFYIQKFYKDSTIIVLPSDHLIVKEDKFLEVVKASSSFVNENEEAIVTIGITPNRPETGYGYIKCGHDRDGSQKRPQKGPQKGPENGCKITTVEQFVEKPDEVKAREYLEDGGYLWNGGMFVWKAENIIKLTQKYMPANYGILSEISCANESDYDNILNARYGELQNISVDYGIMEKADNLYVVQGNFGWDDVGTWNSVERIRNKDCRGNVFSGNVRSIDSSNNIIIGSKKPIVIVGLSDLFIVENDDIIFIGSKENIKNIKEIKNKIT